MKPKIPIEILFVEDNPGDIRLMLEMLKDCEVANHVTVLMDSEEVLPYLRKEGKYATATRPALILLDLNLPKKNGKEVLAKIKAHPVIKRIPVVVFSSSDAEQDIINAYELNANCYIAKPPDLNYFIRVMKAIEDFWLTIVNLPMDPGRGSL